jgi:predicted adenylyl cyclase CyaB
MRRNIELKATLGDPAAARAVSQRLGAQRLGTWRQVDTYFNARHGRLKLREMGPQAQLIWYLRADQHEARASHYLLVDVSDPAAVKAALAGALGVLVIVDKQREVFLWEQVRIHLDEVAGLGRFLEFEAVLDDATGHEPGHAQLAYLMAQFALRPSDLIAGSYADLVAGKHVDRPSGLEQ